MNTGHTTRLALIAFLAGAVLSFLLEHVAGDNARTGEQVLSARPARRIASLTPSVTDCVVALGGTDRLVAVTDFCRLPPEAGELPRLGGHFNPNLERLLAVQPDLIIVQGRGEFLRSFCRRERIEVAIVQMTDIDGVLRDLDYLGRVLGVPDRAEAIRRDVCQTLDSVRRRVAGRPRPRVFLSLYRASGGLGGLSTATGRTYLGELLTLAGGDNVFGELPADYPTISKESLWQRQPEIIIEPSLAGALSPAQEQQRRRDWQTLGEVPAVRTGRVYFPEGDALLKPGPRLAQAALTLAQLIHPELFDDPQAVAP